MPATYVIDLTHYADIWEPDSQAPEEARRFADYIGAMAMAFTASAPQPGTTLETSLRCRRRPRRRPCPGRIVISPAVDASEPAFFWECPGCGERGRTTGFQGSLWDLSRRAKPGGLPKSVMLTEQHYRQMEAILWFDVDVDRIVRGARLTPAGVLLSGTLDELDALVNEIASHANHLPARQARSLDGVLKALAAAIGEADIQASPIVPFRPTDKKTNAVPPEESRRGATGAGYVASVRRGDLIFVAGALAIDKLGNLVGGGNAYRQAQQCLANIEAALLELDAARENLVRLRVYLTNMANWPAVAQAIAEAFGREPPVMTVVEIKALVDPCALLVIEADGVVTP